MSSKKVIDIDFYVADRLPGRLTEYAKQQGFHAEKKIIAVKTLAGPSTTYKFENVGSVPQDFIDYMHLLAKQDGFDLNDVIKRAFGEDC